MRPECAHLASRARLGWVRPVLSSSSHFVPLLNLPLYLPPFSPLQLRYNLFPFTLQILLVSFPLQSLPLNLPPTRPYNKLLNLSTSFPNFSPYLPMSSPIMREINHRTKDKKGGPIQLSLGLLPKLGFLLFTT